RRRHTRSKRDWSSDVCSSDLAVDVLPHRRGFKGLVELAEAEAGLHITGGAAGGRDDALGMLGDELGVHARPLAQLTLVGGHRGRSEERRVGKEWALQGVRASV